VADRCQGKWAAAYRLVSAVVGIFTVNSVIAALNWQALTKLCSPPSERMTTDATDEHRQAYADGRFRRQDVHFRSKISKDGSIPPDKGYYIHYCALICPSTMSDINRPELESSRECHWHSIVGVCCLFSWISPSRVIRLGKNGWNFTPKEEGCTRSDRYYSASVSDLLTTPSIQLTAFVTRFPYCMTRRSR
jgi:glutathionyl-hydroquinone reductase